MKLFSENIGFNWIYYYKVLHVRMTGIKISTGCSDQTDGWKFAFWYIQETINNKTIYYIQETKTTSENVFKLTLKGKVLLRKELKLITLSHFNCYSSHKCSPSKKQLILMIVNYSDLIWFIPCAMLNPNKAGLFQGNLFWMTDQKTI